MQQLEGLGREDGRGFLNQALSVCVGLWRLCELLQLAESKRCEAVDQP